jgi:hypothetical protein
MSHYQKQAKAKCSFSSTRPLGTSTRGGALRIVHELESDTTRDARHSPPTHRSFANHDRHGEDLGLAKDLTV